MRILKLYFIFPVISLLYLSCSTVTKISYVYYKYLPEGKQDSKNNLTIKHPTTIEFNYKSKIILIKSQNKTDTLIIISDPKDDSFIIQNKSDNTNGMMKITYNSCLVVLKDSIWYLKKPITKQIIINSNNQTMKKNKTHSTRKNFIFFLQKSRSGFFLLIILLFSFTSLSGQRPFVTVWNTNINNDNSKQIRFITEGSFLYSYVNVNDSSISSAGQSNGGDIIIDFPQTGNYRLSIIPSSQFKFNSKVTVPNDPEAKKLTSVSQWGDINWKPNVSQMFWYCTNLNIDATDIPDFQNVTNMYSMFAECSNLKTVSGINNWNVGNVTNMSYMFFKNSLFNQSVSNWNVGNVTNMEAMFSFASTFNQPIGSWNVNKVITMRGMFRDTSSFNQPLETWNVGNVIDMYVMFYNAQSFNQPLKNWNVGKANNMGGMFVNAKKFNQSIGNWNVINVTTMEHMFSGATVFNQDLGNWNLKSINLLSNSDGFNSLHNLFDSSGMDCQNYMETLKGWSENVNTPNSLNFGAGGVRYGLEGKTYRDLFVNTKGWNITGDSYSTNCNSSLVVSDISNDEIQIYPNPFRDKFTIDFKNIKSKNVTVKIYSSGGNLVSDKQYVSSKDVEVMGNHLPTGVYTVIVSFDSINKSFQIIKK